MAMRTDLGLQDASPADYSCWAGAGAFLSTPSDLVRFGSAMQKPGLLKAETIALLQTPLRLESGASTGYALGWKVESVQLAGAPARLLGHRGSPMGGTISLVTFPDHGLVIAAASNVSYAKGVAPLGLKVAEAFTRPASDRVR
jgi:CubicO group peptidase (beta-lactamase class C family)